MALGLASGECMAKRGGGPSISHSIMDPRRGVVRYGHLFGMQDGRASEKTGPSLRSRAVVHEGLTEIEYIPFAQTRNTRRSRADCFGGLVSPTCGFIEKRKERKGRMVPFQIPHLRG